MHPLVSQNRLRPRATGLSEIPAAAYVDAGLEDMVHREGQERQVPRAFHRVGEHPLVPSAGPRLSPGVDSGPIRQVAFEHVDAFVIDGRYMVDAEGADLAPGIVSRPAPPLASAASGRRARPAGGPVLAPVRRPGLGRAGRPLGWRSVRRRRRLLRRSLRSLCVLCHGYPFAIRQLERQIFGVDTTTRAGGRLQALLLATLLDRLPVQKEHLVGDDLVAEPAHAVLPLP